VQVCPFFFLQAPLASHVLVPEHSGVSSVLLTLVHVPGVTEHV
jgi:hypothetical protein